MVIYCDSMILIDRATLIRAAHNFKLGDSLHLAAAVEAGYDRFLSPEVLHSLFRFAPPTAEEIAAELAAMGKVEPFEMTDEERAEAEAWEKKVNDYTIANTDKGIEDLFR